jgi:hypothetical protein
MAWSDLAFVEDSPTIRITRRQNFLSVCGDWMKSGIGEGINPTRLGYLV